MWTPQQKGVVNKERAPWLRWLLRGARTLLEGAAPEALDGLDVSTLCYEAKKLLSGKEFVAAPKAVRIRAIQLLLPTASFSVDILPTLLGTTTGKFDPDALMRLKQLLKGLSACSGGMWNHLRASIDSQDGTRRGLPLLAKALGRPARQFSEAMTLGQGSNQPFQEPLQHWAEHRQDLVHSCAHVNSAWATLDLPFALAPAKSIEYMAAKFDGPAYARGENADSQEDHEATRWGLEHIVSLVVWLEKCYNVDVPASAFATLLLHANAAADAIPQLLPGGKPLLQTLVHILLNKPRSVEEYSRPAIMFNELIKSDEKSAGHVLMAFVLLLAGIPDGNVVGTSAVAALSINNIWSLCSLVRWRL